MTDDHQDCDCEKKKKKEFIQVIICVNTTEKCGQNSVLNIASLKNYGGLDLENVISLDKHKAIINIRICTIFIYIHI
jgi:hypothetical protein